jgi:hypothetical protein
MQEAWNTIHEEATDALRYAQNMLNTLPDLEELGYTIGSFAPETIEAALEEMAPDLTEEMRSNFMLWIGDNSDNIQTEMGNYIGLEDGNAGATLNIGESIPWDTIPGFEEADDYVIEQASWALISGLGYAL